MTRKLLGIAVIGLLMTPISASGAIRDVARSTTCLPLPVSTDAKDIHVGNQHYHVPGRTDVKVCTTVDHDVKGTPTLTPYENCGSACFAVRVSDVRAYADVAVELSYKEDGMPKSIPVDPSPVDLGRDIDEVCISNHSAATPDPCVVNILSPTDLRAQGGAKQVALRWSAAKESYGRAVVEPSYEVWRNTSEDLETFELVATTQTVNFTDIGLRKKTTYWYFIVAVDKEGNRSGGSNLASATTD